MRIGLISDTHGLLRPQASQALAGCDRILHAGDIGAAAVLEALARLAPVTAVRGNNDDDAFGLSIPETVDIEIAGLRFHVLHQIAQLRLDALNPRPHIVVYGHSHKPLIERRDDVLMINPGSAGPRRFKLPVTVAEILVATGNEPQARILTLPV